MAQFDYTDTIEDIKEDIKTMETSAFQEDELIELIEALIDPDHIGSSKGEITTGGYANLNAAITNLKEAVDGAFDKSEDRDTDITNFTARDDEITVSSDDTLADVILTINDALGGKSNTDTNSDTAAEISYDNTDAPHMDADDVKSALDELDTGQGNLSFSSGENVDLSSKSDITAAINLLRDYVSTIYAAVKSGITGITKTVLATEPTEKTADTSVTTVIDDTVYIGSDDVRIKAHYQSKKADEIGGGYMNLYIDGTKVAIKGIVETSYDDQELTHTISKSKGNYSIKLEIESTAATIAYAKLTSLYKESVMS